MWWGDGGRRRAWCVTPEASDGYSSSRKRANRTANTLKGVSEETKKNTHPSHNLIFRRIKAQTDDQCHGLAQAFIEP